MACAEKWRYAIMPTVWEHPITSLKRETGDGYPRTRPCDLPMASLCSFLNPVAPFLFFFFQARGYYPERRVPPYKELTNARDR